MEPRDFQATVVENQQVATDIFRIIFTAAIPAAPGQFLMLRAGEGLDPLLRRPFSLHGAAADGTWAVLYRVVGKGSAWLSRRRPGEKISVLGPLGNGFTLSHPGRDRRICLVGGGMGVAPLPFLAEKLLAAGNQHVSVFLGFRSRADMVCVDQLKKLSGCSVELATDDGSAGHHGLVTDLLDRASLRQPFLHVCGPLPMMRAVAGLAAARGWPGEASLETMMACGMSACLGCAIPKKNNQGYWHACKDGPVLDMESIAWQQM